MTHNTREVEEKKYPSHEELDMEKYYRIVKSGSFDNMFNYGFDVGKAFHHQQLQKAREDAQAEYKQFVLNVLDGIDIADGQCSTKAIRFAIQSRIIHSELDQDKQ